MSHREWQVILAGEGGQGLVFIGALLGEAAIRNGKNASQTASYTIASRGGFTKAEVVISSDEISFPGATEPDIILALSEQALHMYHGALPPHCMLVYDSSVGEKFCEDKKIFALPLSEAVREAESKGQKVSLNLIALGAVIGLTGIVGWTALQEALANRFAFPEVVESNMLALRLGAELVKDFQKPSGS